MERVSFDDAAARLTDIILGRNDQNLEAELEAVAASLGLKHIAYVRFAAYADSRLLNAIVTYSPQWQARYYEKQYVLIDPVISRGSKAALPFDWEELTRDDAAIRAFFEDANEYGVGRNGVSIPVRNRKGAYSLVSFTSNHAREEWDKYKRQNISTLQVLSTIIDSAASVTKKVPVLPIKLSRQERQCLILVARGSDYDGIAERFDLTPEDVRRHLDTARHKLHCITLSQAIAVAVAIGVIPPESLG